MSETKILGTVADAFTMMGGELRKDENGKVTNRSTPYYTAKQIPDHLKVRIGSSLKIHLPKLREWIDAGCPRDSNEQQAA